MTADFIPSGSRGDAPEYPKLFGLSLTPTVNGVLVALLGVVGAYFAFTSLAQPALQRNQELTQDIASKEAQLRDRGEFQKQIEQARIRLKAAEQLRADVLSLFANKQSLDTLLIDVNERVVSANSGLANDQRAVLSRFDFVPDQSGPVMDSSLGASVNNRLERQVYDVEIKGSYLQTQSIIRNIERLQPLLVVNEFKSTLDTSVASALRVDGQGRIIPGGQPEARIVTTFKLAALVPMGQPDPGTPAASPTASPAASPAPSP
ncbi:MAG: hypothetical protein MUF49_10700 [Oculatellaceae cyanobacterium Prado106]|jgi:type IV pilus assembly protein PilO|nr:hypothetical protein [Oculatellaceae cyanobacterium Prado106]